MPPRAKVSVIPLGHKTSRSRPAASSTPTPHAPRNCSAKRWRPTSITARRTNNLGTLYLDQGKLYEAAGEFEWARKLMPGHPDPRMNLALTLERAGRTDDALATYATALEVYPGHIPTIQALTRLQLRAGRADHRTAEFLDEIAMRGETDEWKTWARQRRLNQ